MTVPSRPGDARPSLLPGHEHGSRGIATCSGQWRNLGEGADPLEHRIATWSIAPQVGARPEGAVGEGDPDGGGGKRVHVGRGGEYLPRPRPQVQRRPPVPARRGSSVGVEDSPKSTKTIRPPEVGCRIGRLDISMHDGLVVAVEEVLECSDGLLEIADHGRLGRDPGPAVDSRATPRGPCPRSRSIAMTYRSPTKKSSRTSGSPGWGESESRSLASKGGFTQDAFFVGPLAEPSEPHRDRGGDRAPASLRPRHPFRPSRPPRSTRVGDRSSLRSAAWRAGRPA